MTDSVTYTCPVCGYPGLDEPPYTYADISGPSYEICPSCGTEYGYDDDETSHQELREKWLAAGPVWYSKSRPQPEGWDGKKQLNASGLTHTPHS